MSLARESVAARCVTSSIASRTDTAPLSLSIREIASDGARSPARHCTRIARTSRGSIPSVRRVIASASSPARVVMAAPSEGNQQPATRKYVAQGEPQPSEIEFNSRRGAKKMAARKKSSGSRRYGKAASKRVESAMRRRKKGTLKSGSGRKVKSRKQAIAIGLSEARQKGAKVPRKRTGRKSSGRKSSGRKSGGRKSARR